MQRIEHIATLAVFSGLFLLELGMALKGKYMSLAIICGIAVALTVAAGF